MLPDAASLRRRRPPRQPPQDLRHSPALPLFTTGDAQRLSSRSAPWSSASASSRPRAAQSVPRRRPHPRGRARGGLHRRAARRLLRRSRALRRAHHARSDPCPRPTCSGESTYGNRIHPDGDRAVGLVKRSSARPSSGLAVVPASRLQELLYGAAPSLERIPSLPVYWTPRYRGHGDLRAPSRSTPARAVEASGTRPPTALPPGARHGGLKRPTGWAALGSSSPAAAWPPEAHPPP